MPSKNVQLIIGRIATDPDFRQRFFENVDEANAGYLLSAADVGILKRMAGCLGCRASTLMVSKLYQKHDGDSRQEQIAIV